MAPGLFIAFSSQVETIGDAYMVVGGLPERCSKHAAEVASLALHVLDAVPKIRMRNMPAARLHIRIGTKYYYCLLLSYLYSKILIITDMHSEPYCLSLWYFPCLIYGF